MLNIYCGAERTDKEKFIFEHMKGRTLLLVPDQFSLQAERDAFFYLNKKSLMDLRIVDFSILGHKAVNQVGGRKPQLIDKYGRHMLLTKVLRQVEDSLHVYKGMNWKNAFIDMVNSFISEMKRYDVQPEELSRVLDRLDEGSYLKYKLTDIRTIYEAYQVMIDGKYLDSEDYIAFYGEKLLHAPMVLESEVWIYGFDTFTPKNLLVIERLLKAARQVNVVMTYEADNEIFTLTDYVIGRLKELAEDLNEEVGIHAIEGERRATFWNRLDAIMENTGRGAVKPDDLPLTLVAASNFYAEAERAAAYILRLVQEEGYRFGDIAVVCNDLEQRGGILRRTFLRWGIPVFMDQKRKVLHHPAVRFVISLLELIAKGYRDEAVMGLMKSGLLGFDEEEMELLENYAASFKIRGAMWKLPFGKEGGAYDAEALNRLNGLRENLVETVETARSFMGRHNTVQEKAEGLYRFLDEVFGMRERLESLMTTQEAAGLQEAAAETAQSWDVICRIFDQLIEILGSERISNEELLKLMTAGLEEVEIGLVPASADQVIIGTLQRTRASRVKALLAVGANDGLFPVNVQEEGLLSDREKGILESMELEISRRDEVARQEGQLAIYRLLQLPEARLYMSYSVMDESGETLRPAEAFLGLRHRLEQAGGVVLSDLEDSGDFADMLSCKEGALSHMAGALRAYGDGQEIREEWLPVMHWYEKEKLSSFQQVKKGMLFDNTVEAMGKAFAEALYCPDGDKLEVSASRLEKYSGCPFAHFVLYGLRAEDAVVYEMGAREIGDIYHQCLMRLSRKLASAAEDKSSSWMTVTETQIHRQVEHILREELRILPEVGEKSDAGAKRQADSSETGTALVESAAAYGQKEEGYRGERILEICRQAAWSMVLQVRKGRVKEMYFEHPFGYGKAMPPICVDAGGMEVLIQGKIDRLDVLEKEAGDGPDGNGAYPAVRIIDYKTGGDSVDPAYFRNGYKLQLMVYLKAAMEGTAKWQMDRQKNGRPAALDEIGFEPLEPAGVFYFKIRELDTDADLNPSVVEKGALQERLENAYRLEGIVLNDEGLIQAMDMHLEDASAVIPVKRKKDGSYSAAAGGHLLSQEQFDELMTQVDLQVKRICEELCSGVVEARPKRERKKDMTGRYKDACQYCNYRSICLFDTAFEGCRYEPV